MLLKKHRMDNNIWTIQKVIGSCFKKRFLTAGSLHRKVIKRIYKSSRRTKASFNKILGVKRADFK